MLHLLTSLPYSDVTVSTDQLVALTTLFIASIAAPALLAINTARIADHVKKEDWERQDLVAKQAQEDAKQASEQATDAAKKAATAADLLLNAQAETIRRTDEVALVANQAASTAQIKLDQIHTLVNNEMTVARQAERDAVAASLNLLRRIFDMNSARGVPLNQDDMASLATKTGRLVDLDALLASRRAAENASDKTRAAEESKQL